MDVAAHCLRDLLSGRNLACWSIEPNKVRPIWTAVYRRFQRSAFFWGPNLLQRWICRRLFCLSTFLFPLGIWKGSVKLVKCLIPLGLLPSKVRCCCTATWDFDVWALLGSWLPLHRGVWMAWTWWLYTRRCCVTILPSEAHLPTCLFSGQTVTSWWRWILCCLLFPLCH